MFGSPASLFGSLVFSAIGFVAFNYGRKMAAWKPMAIGFALMGYSYFVTETWALYAVGCGLSAALYFFRD